MGRINEYIKLIPKGIKDIDNVAEGILNNIKLEHNLLSEDKQEEIAKRRLICSTCPFMSRNTNQSPDYQKLTGKQYFSARPEDHCSFCGCPISIRTAALEKNCGAEVWNEDNKENPTSLRWEKYE